MYSGQAIAIVMVILVVATVLGASLYSRTLKNREAAINTKDSMMAVEQADSLLDLFVRAEFQFLQELSTQVQNNGAIEYDRLSQIQDFLRDKNVDTTIITSINDWCEYNAESNPSSNIKLTIAEAEPTDYVDVRVGSTRVFNLKDNTYGTNPCNIVLRFEARDNAPTLFAIKEIYGNSNDEIAEYMNDGGLNDDIKAYCFTPNSSSCQPTDLTGIAAPDTSFLDLESGNTLTINLNKSRTGFPLYQIRVIPLNLTLGISHSFPVDCSERKFTYMKVNAAVNCYGSFREKQIMVPGMDSLGYSSIFDYTIYNIGTLRPSN